MWNNVRGKGYIDNVRFDSFRNDHESIEIDSNHNFSFISLIWRNQQQRQQKKSMDILNWVNLGTWT